MGNEFHPEFGKHVYQKRACWFLTEEGKERRDKYERAITNSFCAKNDSQGSIWTWKKDILKWQLFTAKRKENLCVVRAQTWNLLWIISGNFSGYSSNIHFLFLWFINAVTASSQVSAALMRNSINHLCFHKGADGEISCYRNTLD